MASLRRLIWYVGESKNGLTSSELAQKINPDDIREEAHRVCSLITRYKYFFLSEPVSKNPNTGNRYRLSKNGVKFYDNLLLTYDPVTDMQILPHDMNINKIEVN